MSATYQLIADEADFLVVNKSPGVSFHSETGDAGLFAVIEQDFPQYTLYPVHRLDRVTSGLMLVAKYDVAARELGELFEQHRIHKWYVALSDRNPTKKQGTVKGDMLRARDGCWKLSRTLQNPAITRFVSRSALPKVRVFLLQPQTGKTHQLRVMMKSLGSPVLGDSRYGGTASNRVYLHACRLMFDWQGVAYDIVCLPEEGELFVLPEVQQTLIKLMSD